MHVPVSQWHFMTSIDSAHLSRSSVVLLLHTSQFVSWWTVSCVWVWRLQCLDIWSQQSQAEPHSAPWIRRWSDGCAMVALRPFCHRFALGWLLVASLENESPKSSCGSRLRSELVLQIALPLLSLHEEQVLMLFALLGFRSIGEWQSAAPRRWSLMRLLPCTSATSCVTRALWGQRKWPRIRRQSDSSTSPLFWIRAITRRKVSLSLPPQQRLFVRALWQQSQSKRCLRLFSVQLIRRWNCAQFSYLFKPKFNASQSKNNLVMH